MTRRSRRPVRRLATGLALVSLAAGVVAAVPPAQAASPPRPGSGSAGDPYFPRQGNGGYDARHYELRVAYQPATHHLTGRAAITAVATQALSSFHLDLRDWLTVSSVTVDGRPADFTQPAKLDQELIITPQHPIPDGQSFTTVVRYAGPGHNLVDPDGSVDGFIQTRDGAFVAGEPQGAPTWFPVNDTPDDKASYAVTVVVPRGLVAMSNGALVKVTRSAHTTAWSWRIRRPISSYLVTATLGRFQLLRGTTPDGIRYVSAVDPTLGHAGLAAARKMPRIVDYFSSVYGRYPFGEAGVIIDNAQQVGYALETATRPEFDRPPDALTLAHELAHQWFGDDVTLERWRDIWLNEGFAEFSAWLWDEHRGRETAAQHLADLMRVPASNGVWNPPPGDPGSASKVFANSVYERGAGALEALRQKLGDSVFFRILRGWVRQHSYGNARVGQFIHYAEAISGRDLTRFFTRWLFDHGKP